MNLIRTLLCGVLLAMTAAQAAFASDKDYLEALYKRMGTAIASNNADAFMALRRRPKSNESRGLKFA
jgi:hypothetical protein